MGEEESEIKSVAEIQVESEIVEEVDDVPDLVKDEEDEIEVPHVEEIIAETPSVKDEVEDVTEDVAEDEIEDSENLVETKIVEIVVPSNQEESHKIMPDIPVEHCRHCTHCNTISNECEEDIESKMEEEIIESPLELEVDVKIGETVEIVQKKKKEVVEIV